MWRGGSRVGLSVAASFVWRCPSNLAVSPFPHPAHRTGHADRPHPALGQDLTPSSTARRAQAATGVRDRSARRGARVDSPIEKLPFESTAAERQVTNSLQTRTTHGWNGSTGRKADIHGGIDDRLLLADSTHSASCPIAAAPVRTEESDSDQQSRSLLWKS